MILVDASVIIDFFRTRDPKLRNLLNQHSGAIRGLTRAEILHGAHDSQHFQSLTQKLAKYSDVPTQTSTWDLLGLHLFQLRSAGVTVPLSDAILATLAI